MSKTLINQYLNELARLRKVGGTHRESVVSEAFKDLLKGYARSQDLVFIPQHQFKTAARDLRIVDGALLHPLRLPFGYWEAKDEKDDLDAEIEIKFKRGYPKDNIIFEDTVQAVLIQDGDEVIRCKVDDVDALQKLLRLFFGYQRPEIAQFRKAVIQFTTDLPAVLDALREMIDRAHGKNEAFRKAAGEFLDHARKTINPGLGFDDVREILIQHILTDEIFGEVFPGQPFHQDNNVARELQKLEDTFFTGNTKYRTLKALEVYYRAIRGAAALISGHHEKQTFLKVVYENFYKVYNPKAADRLGVVYTPGEIVRFMIESADWLCEQHFKRNLIDRDVEILDPAVGTGTFITELIEHFRGQPDKLRYKYENELHANEVGILPYYVANLNIEATYAAIMDRYDEFPGLCLVDTLDNTAGLGRRTGDQIADLFGMGDENVERIKRQNKRKISVIIGNPPYNANQANENDNNKNRDYPEIDRRIKASYIKASTAQKTKLYDMYARFFRWASDRMHDDGVLAFITNRSFLDARTFDGFRKTVAAEFAEIHVIDLGGDVRANPKLSGTKHNVFGIQTGVAISFLVKKRGSKDARIFYTRRPELETAEEKLAWLSKSHLRALKHEEVRPDAKGYWLNLAINDFDELLPLASKGAKQGKRGEKAIFKLFSLGINTARDEWLYARSQSSLETKTDFLVEGFSRQRQLEAIEDAALKWSEALKLRLAAGRSEADDVAVLRPAMYRPFIKHVLYDSKLFIDRRGSLDEMFPRESTPNRMICMIGVATPKPFSVVAVDCPVDLHLIGAGSGASCFPAARYEGNDVGVDNITDWALKQFRSHYQDVTPAKAGVQRLSAATDGTAKSLGSRLRGNDEQKQERDEQKQTQGEQKQKPGEKTQGRERKTAAIGKEAIFHYVYAVLHDPIYREKYALNLKREFPRIPLYGYSLADFQRWAGWGERLMALHVGYETVEPWPLTRTDLADASAPEPSPQPLSRREMGSSPKPLLKADKPGGRIVLDSETTLSGIPPEAWDYKLGNRSALEWVLDQYKQKKPRDPTIREKFDSYRFADHKETVIDLLMRVTRVSVDTQAIVEAMRTAPR